MSLIEQTILDFCRSKQTHASFGKIHKALTISRDEHVICLYVAGITSERYSEWLLHYNIDISDPEMFNKLEQIIKGLS